MTDYFKSEDFNCSSSSSSPEPVEANRPMTPADNPLRRPAWRWDRIVYLASKAGGKKRNVTAFDDKLIVDGRRYLMHYNQLVKTAVTDGSPADLDNAFNTVYVQYPSIAMAHKIYTERNFARYAIEALVLAKQAPQEIAKDLGCHPDVVITYEFLYYDIRDRIDNSLFIMDALLSPAMKYGMAGTDHDFLWKSIAYSHGVAALKGLWTLGEVDTETKAKLADVMTTLMNRSALRAVAIRQPNQHNAHDILDEHNDKAQIEATAKQPVASSEKTITEGALFLGTAIQLSVASSIAHTLGAREDRANQAMHNLAYGAIDMVEVGPPTINRPAPPALPIPVTDPILTAPPAPVVEQAVERSVYDRPPGPPKNSNAIGKSEEKTDLKEKKDLILKRIRGKVSS